MTIYAPSVGLIWRVLEANGFDPHSLIRKEIYDPENQSLFNERVRWADVVEITKKAEELIGDPALGLQMASHIHPSHLGALGYAWMASSSLRTALRRLLRFNRMLDEQVASQLEETEAVVRVVYEVYREHPFPDLAADSNLSCLLALCRLNFGEELVPAEVTMKRSEPENSSRWHEHFGTRVRFGQSTDSIAFSTTDADHKLTSSNRELVYANEDLVQRHLAFMDRNHIKSRVQLAIIEELPSGGVSEEHVAELLNMSTRNLHRKLSDDGTTFRSLLVEVRQELALRYVRDSKYSITEIAFMLGFSETSAFSRAFRNWFEVSPTVYRETAAGQTS